MASGFDLQKYLRNSKAVEVRDLPWDHVREHPLREAEIRFLKYMMNIETHTIVYLKELLGTNVIRDGEVTAFLSCWAYEEFFHGMALERFLKEYVGEKEVLNDTSYRLQQSTWVKRTGKKVLGPVVSALTPDFAATHMTWGATQELTTLHAYESVARQTDHPMLKELMARIVRDERRHFAFYYNQAETRLTKTPGMRRVTRLAMDKLWSPVGVGTMPGVESDFTSWYLFRDGEGQNAIDVVDQTMSQLPGMQAWTGLRKATTAQIQRHEARSPDSSWAFQVRKPVAPTVQVRSRAEPEPVAAA